MFILVFGSLEKFIGQLLNNWKTRKRVFYPRALDSVCLSSLLEFMGNKPMIYNQYLEVH